MQKPSPDLTADSSDGCSKDEWNVKSNDNNKKCRSKLDNDEMKREAEMLLKENKHSKT